MKPLGYLYTFICSDSFQTSGTGGIFKGFMGLSSKKSDSGSDDQTAAPKPTFNFGFGTTKSLTNGSQPSDQARTDETSALAPKLTQDDEEKSAESSKKIPDTAFGSVTSDSGKAKTSSVLDAKTQPAASNGTGEKSPKSSHSQYLSQLKSLNEGVLKWIQGHVTQNPYCILTPVFKDYETHLAKIEKKYPRSKKEEEEEKEKKTTSPAKSTTIEWNKEDGKGK